MAEIIKLRNNPHQEVQELLPWLVNGTLAQDEIALVEAHLSDCAECQAELAAERQLAAAIESSPIDSEAAWERMERRLEEAANPRLRALPSLWRKRVPIGWAVASPMAAAAALALIIINVPSRQPVDAQYRALGAPDAAPTANLIVQFQPTTRISEVQGALQSVDARLVDGPTQTGAYLLHVDQAKRELALKQLRDNQAIALAQPIDGPARE
jgi:anti-sigma factor RsiW